MHYRARRRTPRRTGPRTPPASRSVPTSSRRKKGCWVRTYQSIKYISFRSVRVPWNSALRSLISKRFAWVKWNWKNCKVFWLTFKKREKKRVRLLKINKNLNSFFACFGYSIQNHQKWGRTKSSLANDRLRARYFSRVEFGSWLTLQLMGCF